MKKIHVHLVSDSTGETVTLVARACLAQFENINAEHHHWSLVRKQSKIKEILQSVKKLKGFVIYTLVDSSLRSSLELGCHQLQVPCISLLDPIINAMGKYLGSEMKGRPGRQHELDSKYFDGY